MSSTLSASQLKVLCQAAVQAALKAGKRIEEFDRHKLLRTHKNTGNSEASQLVTEADFASEEIIRDCLMKASESLDIAFLGEESALNIAGEAGQRLVKPYFWCVDPLDGTLPFAEGRMGYAVSIALIERSGKPVVGVVYDPATQVLLHAIEGQGSYRNFRPFSRSKLKSTSLKVYADVSFKTHAHYQGAMEVLKNCAQIYGMNDVIFVYGNGAVMNACLVLNSSLSCYFKLPKVQEGGGSIWDYAATCCITRESGGWTSDIHGHALNLNPRASTFMNRDGVIFASDKRIAEFLIDAFGK